jgi:hypothetical protein
VKVIRGGRGYEGQISVSLRTWAVNVYGGETCDKRWGALRESVSYTDVSRVCRLAVLAFVARHPTLEHICDPGDIGPLSCERHTGRPFVTRPSVFIHTTSLNYPYTLFLIGKPTRWYIHAPPSSTSYSDKYGGTLCYVDSMLETVIEERVSLAGFGGPEEEPPSWDLRDSVYLNFQAEGCEWTGEEDRKAAHREEAVLAQSRFSAVLAHAGTEEGMGEDEDVRATLSNLEDSLGIPQLFDAPECRACGWSATTGSYPAAKKASAA